MAVATLEKCACQPCSCAVSPDSAVKKGGKLYCSVACAEGHFSYQLSVTSCSWSRSLNLWKVGYGGLTNTS